MFARMVDWEGIRDLTAPFRLLRLPSRMAGTNAAGGDNYETDFVLRGGTRTDEHAKADKGATKTYTLDHDRVTFGHGVD